MGLLDCVINDIDIVVSLYVDLTSRNPFNYTPTLLISMPVLFNPLIFLESVNYIHYIYVVERGALKRYKWFQGILQPCYTGQ